MAMPNNVWEEISQEILSFSNPSIRQYLSDRFKLMNREKTTRSDQAFRSSLSPQAKRACRIVDNIRRHESETVWTPDVEEKMASEGHQSIFPGMMFMMAKDRMESTKLWKIVRNMPKGCLLHAHMDAMVDFDFLLDELLKQPGMHMSAEQPLSNKDALENAGVSFRYRANEVIEGNIWDGSYKSNKFLLLTKVADEFPDGGRSGFLKWLKSRCTLSMEDSHQQHHGIKAIWEKFTKCFAVADTIIHYEPMLRAYLRRLMAQLKADGVRWVELR